LKTAKDSLSEIYEKKVQYLAEAKEDAEYRFAKIDQEFKHKNVIVLFLF
jgi:hypothetical protein